MNSTQTKVNPVPPGHRRVGMEGSHVVALAVKQCNVDVVAAYPITPQTHIVEKLAEMVANGELDAEFVLVESEHSAMTVCLGAEAAGARTFTCTSAQGLILMSEIVYIASAMRLPCVMVLANRSLSGPLSIWCDHSDVMSIRDCGWIQTFAENAQEVYDLVFHAYRVAEMGEVLTPVVLNMDGFFLTHVVEPLMVADQGLVDHYLPPYRPRHTLHPDRPVTMGAYGVPELFTETKKAQDEALRATLPHIVRAWKEWGDLTGRSYRPVETYRTDGARVLLFTMGSIGQTAMVAVDAMRDQGLPVGLVKLRLWRPFPHEDLRRALAGAEHLVVLDRAVSFGGPGGPVASEIRSALYGQAGAPVIHDFIVGLAGRDVAVPDFEAMVREVLARESAPRHEDYVIYGVRG